MNIKNQDEIKKMTEAGKILGDVLKLIRQKIQVGISAKELDDYAEKCILARNAIPAFKNFNGYPNSICVSINEEIVHGIPTSGKKIKEGDIVGIDCGVKYEGYNSDAAFTIGVGKISPLAKRIIETTKKSLNKAIVAIKPGIELKKIQKIIQKTIEDEGFAVIRSLSGHGIGKNLHEAPTIFNYVDNGPKVILKQGMTICIEPMSAVGTYEIKTENDNWTIKTLDNSISAHFEHTILITDKAAKILTPYD
jgi:methionyl aminopeptidase